jgi:hypothetical protein
MKIPLRVHKQFDELMISTTATIKALHVRRPLPLEFLVDTGSPWMALAPRDVKKTNIPIQALKKPTKYVTILFAGAKFWRYLLTNASVYVVDELSKMVKIDLPMVSVLWPTKGNPEEFDSIPSVLGCDFITIGEFDLHFCPSTATAFLEKPEKQ